MGSTMKQEERKQLHLMAAGMIGCFSLLLWFFVAWHLIHGVRTASWPTAELKYIKYFYMPTTDENSEAKTMYLFNYTVEGESYEAESVNRNRRDVVYNPSNPSYYTFTPGIYRSVWLPLSLLSMPPTILALLFLGFALSLDFEERVFRLLPFKLGY